MATWETHTLQLDATDLGRSVQMRVLLLVVQVAAVLVAGMHLTPATRHFLYQVLH
jgi:hypothetical protein